MSFEFKEENIKTGIRIKENIKSLSKENDKNKLIQMTNEMAQTINLMDLTNNQFKSLLFMLKNTKMNSKPKEMHEICLLDYLKQYELNEKGITFYKNELKQIRDKSVWIGDNLVGIVEKVIYDPKSKSFLFRYDEDFEKQLLNLKDFYLLTWAINAECLPDKGSSSFYLYLRSFLSKGETDISYTELKPKITEPKMKRKKSQIQKSVLTYKDVRYDRYRDWKKNILEPYIDTINKLTDIYVKYEEFGKKDEERHFKFIIKENLQNEDMIYRNDPTKKIVKNKKAKENIEKEIDRISEQENINMQKGERLNNYISEKLNHEFHFTKKFAEILEKTPISEEMFKILLDIASLNDPITSNYIKSVAEDWYRRKIDLEDAKNEYLSIVKQKKEKKEKGEKYY